MLDITLKSLQVRWLVAARVLPHPQLRSWSAEQRQLAIAPAAEAAATPAFVQQASAHGSGKSSIAVTTGASVTAGDRLVVEVTVWNSKSATTSSVTDSLSDPFVEVTHFTASDDTEMSIWTAPVTERWHRGDDHRQAHVVGGHGDHRPGVLGAIDGGGYHRGRPVRARRRSHNGGGHGPVGSYGSRQRIQ